MNKVGKSIKQIKQEDYIKLVELVGKEKADRIFEDDKDLDDDTKYPGKVIATTILIAIIKKYIVENPSRFLLIVLIVILIAIWF